MPSGVGSFFMPRVVNPSAMAAMRSLSLTRSSLAPRRMVVPVAQAAAINSAGNSSIAKGTSSSGISIPCSGAWRTCKSATGSPPISRGLRTVMSAPIRVNILRIPTRVGFIPTCFKSTSEPGAILAPTSKNAAEETSAGMSIVVPCKRPPPSRPITPFVLSTS